MNKTKPTSLKSVFWETFSEADTRFLDLFRVGYGLGILSFVILSFWSVWNGSEFDPVAWGTGFGALLFGGATGVGLRGRWEDGQCPPDPYDYGPRPGDSGPPYY